MLSVPDEVTRQALAATVHTGMCADDVLETLYPLLFQHGTSEYTRSDKGPEYAAGALHAWLRRICITPTRMYPFVGRSNPRPIPFPPNPRENGYNARFNGALGRKVLNAEWLTTTEQVQIVINPWLKQSTHIRPHQPLEMRPPVPENP